MDLIRKQVPGICLAFSFLAVFFSARPLYSQTPAVVISSYFNSADPRDEWTELLVVADNTDLNGWALQDNNETQSGWQPAIAFSNPAVWNHLRAGTIIVIWHRNTGSNGVLHLAEAGKEDGYLELSANDPAYFSGGSFGNAPLYAGPTLNIAAAEDLLLLQDASGTFVHALGHGSSPGSSWTSLPLPKLNHHGALANGEAVSVCPGSALDEYGTLPPQDGTAWTNAAAVGITQGLPNVCSGSTSSDFWRELRQPSANPDSLFAEANPENTLVTLTWPAVPDTYPADGIMGYMVLSKPDSPCYGPPLDGFTYLVGERMNVNDTVIALIENSQILTYVDTISIPCGSTRHYRIYAYRYQTDEVNGNGYHSARGRAYNQGLYGYHPVTLSTPTAPVSVASDRNNLCPDDPGDITLTATGGSGSTLRWFTGDCGTTLVGSSVSSNTLTLPSPEMTTTYFARWENVCGISSCESVTVNIVPSLPISVSITADQNPVCSGTPVTFTAEAENPGTVPLFQWTVNGIGAGANSQTFTYVPSDGDEVRVVMTSSVSCASGNPAISNPVEMTVSDTLPLTVSLAVDPGDTVCYGDSVTYRVYPNNGGPAPLYEWFLNGMPAGGTGQAWSTVPADSDMVWCRVTSNSSCVTNSPRNTDTLTMTVIDTTGFQASVGIVSDNDSLCPGTAVTFTAIPFLGGDAPLFEWFVDGIRQQEGSSRVFMTDALTGGETVQCRMTSSMKCLPDSQAISAPLHLFPATPPVVRLSDKPYLCAGEQNLLDAGPGFAWYRWQDGSAGRYYTATEEGIYQVRVADSSGCLGGDTVQVKACETLLIVPNAFTPNGDGLNDLFKPAVSGEGIVDFSLQVYNRWGQMIFSSSDLNRGWDGMDQGQYAPEGTYIWLIKYQTASAGNSSGPAKSLHGTVELIR